MAAFKFRELSGSLTAPRGFRAAAVFCDIKRLGTGKGSNKAACKRDLALVVSDVPAAVAGMFTTNRFAAAPVRLCLERVAGGTARAVVVNSGNANACTGARGLADARTMTRVTAKELALAEDEVLVCSTGRIGAMLPMENVTRGIRAAAPLLAPDEASAHHFAEAIMTSDSRAKELAIEFTLDGATVRMAGVCKGAGMIQPGMSATSAPPAAGLHATMLAFVTTDAAIAPALLQRALAGAVARSFNRITIDGDMSTNDTVLALANGCATNKKITSARAPAFAIFQQALDHVTAQLARMIVLDGEGTTRFVAVQVHGAKSAADADAAARAIANSVLVKTSWCGGDPNWGRVLCAVGYSRAAIDESKIDIGYRASGKGAVRYALRRGQPANTALAKLVEIVAEKEFEIHVYLNLGKHDAVIYASDLTEAYVEFNKGDLSNPESLGG